MSTFPRILMVVALLGLAASAETAWAQFGQLQTPSVSRITSRFRAPTGRPSVRAPQRPTVSPYLNLLNDSTNAGVPNYQTLVRPQVDQMRTNARVNQQLGQLNRAVSSGHAPVYSGVQPTGRQTGRGSLSDYYGYLSHFYGQ